MKKLLIFLAMIIGLVSYLSNMGWTQKPVMEEQLVYRQRFFDGKGYGGKGHPDGFIPHTEDTIYLIADHDNTISARITLVYFWPVAAKYRANWEVLNEEVEGTLEILKDEKVIKSLEKENNCIYYPEGYIGEASLLYTGEKAEKMRKGFEEIVERYYMAVRMWRRKVTEYNKKVAEFRQEMEKIREKWRETGEEPSDEEIEKLILKKPEKSEPPEPPKFYVTEPRKDYTVNLPQGTYKIRVRAKDGTAQDSQKNLVVFGPRKTAAIGYEIVPENRWAKRESCDDPRSIIYVEGEENTLYFQPFYQDEYNEFYYNKLADPQNYGREKKWRWVRSEFIKNGLLVLLKEGKIIKKIENIPYYAKEIRGEQRGFDIIEYKKEEMSPDIRPTFEGHKVNLSSELVKGNCQVNLGKKNTGEFVKGGEREIRLVTKENSKYFYPFALFPLVIGLVIFIQRRKELK